MLLQVYSGSYWFVDPSYSWEKSKLSLRFFLVSHVITSLIQFGLLLSGMEEKMQCHHFLRLGNQPEPFDNYTSLAKNHRP